MSESEPEKLSEEVFARRLAGCYATPEEPPSRRLLNECWRQWQSEAKALKAKLRRAEDAYEHAKQTIFERATSIDILELDNERLQANLAKAISTLGAVGRPYGLQPPLVEDLQRLAAKTFVEIGGRYGP